MTHGGFCNSLVIFSGAAYCPELSTEKPAAEKLQMPADSFWTFVFLGSSSLKRNFHKSISLALLLWEVIQE